MVARYLRRSACVSLERPLPPLLLLLLPILETWMFARWRLPSSEWEQLSWELPACSMAPPYSRRNACVSLEKIPLSALLFWLPLVLSLSGSAARRVTRDAQWESRE